MRKIILTLLMLCLAALSGALFVINDNTKLAKAEETKYTLTFELPEWMGSIDSMKVTAGETIVLPTPSIDNRAIYLSDWEAESTGQGYSFNDPSTMNYTVNSNEHFILCWEIESGAMQVSISKSLIDSPETVTNEYLQFGDIPTWASGVEYTRHGYDRFSKEEFEKGVHYYIHQFVGSCMPQNYYVNTNHVVDTNMTYLAYICEEVDEGYLYSVCYAIPYSEYYVKELSKNYYIKIKEFDLGKQVKVNVSNNLNSNVLENCNVLHYCFEHGYYYAVNPMELAPEMELAITFLGQTFFLHGEVVKVKISANGNYNLYSNKVLCFKNFCCWDADENGYYVTWKYPLNMSEANIHIDFIYDIYLPEEPSAVENFFSDLSSGAKKILSSAGKLFNVGIDIVQDIVNMDLSKILRMVVICIIAIAVIMFIKYLYK